MDSEKIQKSIFLENSYFFDDVETENINIFL